MVAALTAEEWADLLQRKVRPASTLFTDIGTDDHRDHGVAALCLYGQPFGFTREDVDALRFFAKNHYQIADVDRATTSALGRKVESAADRIAALLPPREETRG